LLINCFNSTRILPTQDLLSPSKHTAVSYLGMLAVISIKRFLYRISLVTGVVYNLG